MSESRIAICLFKPEITELNVGDLVTGRNLERVQCSTETEVEALLFQRKSEIQTPAWVDIVQEFGNFDITKLRSASSGALLFLKIENRIIGCCFGTSVANINRQNIETSFGLGVAYQKMSTNQLKSVESFMLSNNPIVSSRRATIPTVRSGFNLDDLLENITEFAGYGFRNSRRIKLKGKEFFSSPSPGTFEGIVELCQTSLGDYLVACEDDNFKQLTSTRLVKEKSLIQILDDEVCRLLNRKHENIFLTDYDFLDDAIGYRLTPKGTTFTELEIESFYNTLNENQRVTTPFLKSRKVFPISESEEELANWSFYKCLFVELDQGNEVYILYKGKWYNVNQNYLAELREIIRRFEIEVDFLPKWDGEEDENTYNNRAAEELKGQCWDTMLYRCDLYNYGVEFCDILHHNSIFHVKKYKKSALSSHLLLQTAVSAELLAIDPQMRQWIEQKANSEFAGVQHLSLGRDFSRSDITYYVILMSDRDGALADILPFFSLISFNLMLRKVQQLGYNIRIGKV